MNKERKFTKDVSIIIVNYHTSELVNNCVASIIQLTKKIDYEIIIVDNCSEDLVSTIPLANDKRIKIIQLSENIGFGRANNKACKFASGRYLFFLNPDTLLLNNAIKILYDYMEINPDCGACGGNLYDLYENPIHSYRRALPGLFDSLNILLNNNLAKIIWGKNNQFNKTEIPIKVGYITGADLMVRANLFYKLGGFDPAFFLYYEETDLCCRIKNESYNIVSVPEAKIIHLVGQSHNESQDSSPNEFVYNCEGNSRRIYFKKHLSSMDRMLSRVILRMNYRLRYILYSIKKDKFQMDVNSLRLKFL